MVKGYQAKYEAIIDLHQKGYTEDFLLKGKNLLWIQGKQRIAAEDFCVTEHHLFSNSVSKGRWIMIFGIVGLCEDIKGILISYQPGFPHKFSPVIRRKLKTLSTYADKGSIINHSS